MSNNVIFDIDLSVLCKLVDPVLLSLLINKQCFVKTKKIRVENLSLLLKVNNATVLMESW